MNVVNAGRGGSGETIVLSERRVWSKDTILWSLVLEGKVNIKLKKRKK